MSESARSKHNSDDTGFYTDMVLGRASRRVPSPYLRPEDDRRRTVQTYLSDRQLQDAGLEIASYDASRFINQRTAKPDLHGVGEWLVMKSPTGPHASPPAWFDKLEARIEALRSIAAEESIKFSQPSANAALGFARAHANSRPSVFLIANGNTRLLWLGDEGEQVGMQFMPSGEIQYVLFERGSTSEESMMGRRSPEGMMRLLRQVGLARLI